MPTYEYQCTACENEFDVVLRMADYDLPQNCPECKEGPAKKLISKGVGLIFSGDNWVSKNNRVEGQMAQKNKNQAKRQEEKKRAGTGMTLAPNVGGERVDSWSEASKLAASQGKNTDAYDKKARVEKV